MIWKLIAVASSLFCCGEVLTCTYVVVMFSSLHTMTFDYWTGDHDIVSHWLPIFLNRFPTMASHQGVLTLALTVVLLALPSLTCGVTLHVRPTSTNTSCPTHPCQTLSEYAQDPGQYFNDSNLTLTFLPGNHTLDINLTITNINQLKIHGALLPTKVVCRTHVGFTLSNIYRMSFCCLCRQT